MNIKEMDLLHMNREKAWMYKLDKENNKVVKVNSENKIIGDMTIAEFKIFLESEIRRDEVNESRITEQGFRVLSGKIA